MLRNDDTGHRVSGVLKPKFYKSQAFKIFVSFVIFGTLLTAVDGVLVIRELHMLEEEIMTSRISEEADIVAGKLARNEPFYLVRSRYMNMYVGLDEIPAPLVDLVRDLSPGEYDTQGPLGIGGEGDYKIAVREISDTPDTLYFIFNEGDFEKRFLKRKRFQAVFKKGFILAVFLSLIVGFINAKRLIKPMRRLASQVLQSEPDNLPLHLSKDYDKDEVGVLATVLDHAMQRIHDFIEREKQFTRDASHELRTPVTAIRGAVEIIEQYEISDDSAVSRPLKRISRAIKDMEATIDTFLWLAREEETGDMHPCDIAGIVKDVIDDNRYLLAEKQVTVSLNEESSALLQVYSPVFKIAVSNLVRNAFQYTSEGHVSVTVKNQGVEVTDTGIGIRSDEIDTITETHKRGASSKGFGLGLAIVKRLCDRFGWRLDIESTSGDGTVVTLIVSGQHLD